MTARAAVSRSLRGCFGQPNPSAVFKRLMSIQRQTLCQRYRPDRPVTALLAARSRFIDQLLICCWRYFLGDRGAAPALIATGGYGRGELFPHSDIDIMVLATPEDKAQLQDALANFSRFLWDIGLKPGQCVRTPDECLEAAGEDQTIYTSMLEMRLIQGSSRLFAALRARLDAQPPWTTARFFQAKLAEQAQRYAKYHHTAYNLEPNIKDGPGGLRDLQVIAWLFRQGYRASTLRALIRFNFLTRGEFGKLLQARDQLWRLRYALHELTGRGEDRLLFDCQRDLAVRFGYVNAERQPDVERFMRFYFRTVLEIESLNEILLQLLGEKLVADRENLKPMPINAQFGAIGGYLEARDQQVFEREPLALLEIFLLMQRLPSLKGIRANTVRLIRKNVHRIDAGFRGDPRATKLFLDILRQPRGITHELKRMNRYGVLPAYLPDFANIVARMQYDLFHIYTVDEHTLFVVRNLRRFALDEHAAEMPFCSRVFLLISKPEVLYIAALFHDIAKGRGGDHSVLGEDISREFCQRHGLPSHDVRLASWLVRHHLLMSMTAQRKDISDPAVIHDFALQVGSIEYLNHLYLLTVADIRATNPSLWNSWKDSLLRELYIATFNALHRGLHNPVVRSERLCDNIREARDELRKLGMSTPSIDASWRHLSDDYFLRYSADEIAWHTVAIAAQAEEELPLVLLRPQTQRASAEIFVYARNESGIFSICTATLDQLGLSVLDARIITTSDQYVLNSFQVLEQSGQPIRDLCQECHIASTLRQNLLSRKAIKTPRNLHKQSRQARHFPIETRLTFLEDLTNRHTAIELITTDRAGLLSTIGRAFSELDIQLHDARITTIGSRAEDVFYVSDRNNRPITDPAVQGEVRERILALLNEAG